MIEKRLDRRQFSSGIDGCRNSRFLWSGQWSLDPLVLRRPAGLNSPATRSSAGFAILTGCIDLDGQEGDGIQRFTKSADNSAPIRFSYCAWICLDSWVSFDLPLALRVTPDRNVSR